MSNLSTMNVMSFAQEFSSLVIRYTKDPLPNPSSKNKQPNVPLTKHEVTNVVTNVLATLLGISDININNTSFKTPTGSTVTTPTASVIDNWKENDENICRSQDIQETPKNSGTSNPDLETDEKKSTYEVFQDGKKFISRSSPAICINNVGRSDTFILDENQSTEADLKTFNDPFAKVEMTSAVLQSLNEARMFAMNVVTKLDEIKKQAFPQSLNARRLSTNEINSNRMSNTTRLTIPAKVRRSISDFPGTPTSSRSSGSQDSGDKRKSFGAAIDTASRKLSSTAVTRSISNLHLSSNNKSFDSISKPTKNPKYAHIQSTIPKPIASKRKA
ncbi:uncharacterized protein LOC116854140 [Odontomachus brunneus]|uniref:uncharacterized protein LOC116854140 n=1 Tax=Odontomachus brunneus TaxID=486640 RepID=UPI0013F29DDA|nr:uncharacterized protein LOC116854140 [Odontomachus brunneus]